MKELPAGTFWILPDGSLVRPDGSPVFDITEVEEQEPKGSKPSKKSPKSTFYDTPGVDITAQRVKEGFGVSILGNNNPAGKALRERKAEK